MHCPCPEFDIQKYKGKPYQETPCSSCFLTRQTNKTNKHSQLFDTDGATQDVVDQNTKTPADSLIQQQSMPSGLTPDAIELIMQACQQNFLVVLSNVVLKLTDLAKTYPALYQILHLKMQYPHLSYYEIGARMSPPCSKQNVLYHLEHAVKQFPQLHKAILTDTRFSGGRYAIRTQAQKARHKKAVQKVRHLLYEQTEINSQKSMQELMQIFNKPFKPSNIVDFTDYTKE